jgi:hypothetical protein
MHDADLRDSSILSAEILSADFRGANLPTGFDSFVSDQAGNLKAPGRGARHHTMLTEKEEMNDG